MRIAIVNWSSRKVGGAETYLDRLIGGLRCAGHEPALFCETDLPADRAPITLPWETPLWSVSKMGLEPAVSALRGWCPDVIYGHGVADPDIEARTLEVAPAVLFAHNYYGTCISGAKTFKFSVVRPCSRRFGWQCLAHFYPHRCGGLNPITMWKDFQRESQRLKILHSYQAIATASEHMRSEYMRHGFAPESVKVIPCPSSLEATGTNGPPNTEGCSRSNGQDGVQPAANRAVGVRAEASPYRLLFVGRMEWLKGGAVLLDTLPLVLAAIEQPLQMTFVGDGTERARWEEKAANIQSREPRLRIEFTGWLEGAQLTRAFGKSDLLVVPSLWPEPFGLVGPEAGLHGLPAAAFDAGGISDWLTDGVNGYLASGHPPSPNGLAQAIVKCLNDPANYQRLRQGAVASSSQFSLRRHVVNLLGLFERVIGNRTTYSGFR